VTPTQLAAMEQALEVLEHLQGGCTDSDDGTVEAITVWCPEVIDDLRAALSEQAVEPVGFGHFFSGELIDSVSIGFKSRMEQNNDMSEYNVPLYTAPQPPAPSVDYKPLTDPHDHPDPHSYKWTQSEMDYINRRVAAAIAAQEAKK
jgi:hypothetical protein